MEERIADILRANFAGAQVNLVRDTRNERINGRLLWEGFDGHDFLWRQNKIFRVLRRELGPEATMISHIFTYTPNEYEQMMAA
jgi:hypothetical protein